MNAAGSLRTHWKFFMMESVILGLLGLAAIILPQVASVAIEILSGWLLLMGGIALITMVLDARTLPIR